MATTQNPHDLLRLKQAAAYINVSEPTLWRLPKRDPSFPRKIKMGERLCFYRKADLDQWMADKEVRS